MIFEGTKKLNFFWSGVDTSRQRVGNIFVTDGTEGDAAASSGEVSVPTPAGYKIPTEALAIALLTTDESGNEIQEVDIELTDNGFSPGLYPSESFDVSTGDNRFYCYVKVVDDLPVDLRFYICLDI